MNKKLKEKLIQNNKEMSAAFPNLYDLRWVEKAADKGWKDLVKDMKGVEPKLAEIAEKGKGYNVFAAIYFSAFETALNTFFAQCLDDTITNIELDIRDLQNITAEMKNKEG